MNFMASGRCALIITAGLWLCLAAPIRAQQSDQDATANSASDATANTDNPADAPVVPNRPVKPRPKRAAAQSHQPARVASKPWNGRKTDDAQALQDDPSMSGFPSSVSNAKAQFGAGGSSLADSALKTMSTQAENMLETAKQVDPATAPAERSVTKGALVAPDQVNDVDRTVSQDTAPAPTLSMMVPQTPTTVSNVDSTWGRTSLIGKVFVALGGLLTLASAARMFIA